MFLSVFLVSLAGCAALKDTDDTGAALSGCGPADPASAVDTSDLFGADSEWVFSDVGKGTDLLLTLQGGDGWTFGLDAIIVEYQVEYYPSTACTLDGQRFLCEPVVWGSDHLFEIEGTFSADFRGVEVTIDRDSPDKEEGDRTFSASGALSCLEAQR